MQITIKTPEDIIKMREAGHLAASVLEMVGEYVVPGVTTDELDIICDKFTREHGATSAPLNYNGYPKHICTSVNHVVCHGIPNDKKLKKGDIVNVDVTVLKDGYHGDTSKMFCVGEVAPYAQRLIDVTQQCLYLGIRQVKPGNTFNGIGKAIQPFAEKNHYTVVREYCGHGIGKIFHEDPQVLHYDCGEDIAEIQPGMCFTIEPMINAGKRHVKKLGDGWTVMTKDRKLSAQWEHTLLVTEDGCDILTLRAEESLEEIFSA